MALFLLNPRAALGNPLPIQIVTTRAVDKSIIQCLWAFFIPDTNTVCPGLMKRMSLKSPDIITSSVSGAQLQEVPTAEQKEQQAEQWCSKKLFVEGTLPYIPQHIHSLVGYALNRISVRISFLLWRHLIWIQSSATLQPNIMISTLVQKIN